MEELAKAYEPEEVEPRWYQFWTEQGVFHASDAEGDARPVYVIALPLPNITGSLHMDHAGIATQTVVERQLRREGKSPHDPAREKFVDRLWQWEPENGGRIEEQM